MEKKMLWAISILLVMTLALQCVFIQKLDRIYEGMGGLGESMSERIDRALENMQELNQMLEEVSENK